MPRGRYQQQQWETRETAILDALGELSSAHGFAQVTMDDLAEAVGISKATLYQHFASKDEMLIRLMAHHTALFVAWLTGTADQQPLERLRLTMRYLMEGEIAPLRGLISMGRDQLIPHIQAGDDLLSEHAQGLALLGDIIRQGQAEGTIAADLAPSVIISAMWALSNVTLHDYSPLRAVEPPPSPEMYTNHMLALFERSIRPTHKDPDQS